MAETAPQPRQGRNVAELSVSELAFALKRTIEDSYGHVRLRGEIFGYRGPHSSGHCYFSLKDDKAKIDAVVWKGIFNGLRFKPEEGMEVVVTGKVTTYPGSSKYQIVIESLEPAGAGALMALLEERKKKLAAEGLFDEKRKRPIPFLPRVVGIITSPTGAVIRDMLAGFAERFPTHVVVWPVRVQGETSAREVANAINGFNALQPGGRIPRPDLLIVARGGGSLEDLWGFNEEVVVRAAAASRIPLISAVGHETDWTLIDLASDARAPTPTKAAEWAVPKKSDLMQRLGEQSDRLALTIRRLLENERRHLTTLARALPRPADLVALPRQRFDAAAGRLPRALAANTQAHGTRLARLSGRLAPQLVRQRIVRARDRIDALGRFANQALARVREVRRARLDRAGDRLKPQTLMAEVGRGSQRTGELGARLKAAMAGRTAALRRALDAEAKMLVSLSHRSVLARGFALVRDESGQMIRQASAIGDGQRLELELADGRRHVRAEGSGTASPPPPSAPPKPPRGPSGNRGGGGQGQLF
ncbi:MAG: exodeoxyribonuclease VII large subunit [Hyphomicrobiaceae bacterium]